MIMEGCTFVSIKLRTILKLNQSKSQTLCWNPQIVYIYPPHRDSVLAIQKLDAAICLYNPVTGDLEELQCIMNNNSTPVPQQ